MSALKIAALLRAKWEEATREKSAARVVFFLCFVKKAPVDNVCEKCK